MPREPEGQAVGGALSFGYFSLGKQRKVTRPAGRNHTFNYTKKKNQGFRSNTVEQQETSSKPIRSTIRG
jgi:hypothetical protein